MGKNKKSTVTIDDEIHGKYGYQLDSAEEWYFYQWLMEAMKFGIVIDFEYQPASFQLTEKAKYVPVFGNPKQKEKHLLAEHVYTADFRVTFDKKYGEKLSEYFKIPTSALNAQGNPNVWIDIKGGFNRFGGDRTFSINQKLVWNLYGIYVQKVVPGDCFEKLGMPEAAKYTIKTKKSTDKFLGCRLLKDVLIV